jgi:hypothetical protein
MEASAVSVALGGTALALHVGLGLAEAPTLAVVDGLSLAVGVGDLIQGSSAAHGVRVTSEVGLQLGVTEGVGTDDGLSVAEVLLVDVADALRDCGRTAGVCRERERGATR